MVSGQSMRSGRLITVTKVCGVEAVKQKMTYEDVTSIPLHHKMLIFVRTTPAHILRQIIY
jgi:hypothetical protein